MNRKPFIFKRCSLVAQWCKDHVPVFHCTVIALKVKGAGLGFVGGHGTAGAALNRLIIDDGHTIENHREMTVQ